MMINTNRNANYFPHTYHIRSRLTINGVRQRFSYGVEAYLRKQPVVETAVLAVLRTETAISRSEIITACREYLLEQADPDFPTDCSTSPTDDDIALAIVQLVDMGVAELVVIKEEPVSASVPANPLEKEASIPVPPNPLEQASQGNPAFSFSSMDVPFSDVPFSLATIVPDTPLIWLQQFCSPRENYDGNG